MTIRYLPLLTLLPIIAAGPTTTVTQLSTEYITQTVTVAGVPAQSCVIRSSTPSALGTSTNPGTDAAKTTSYCDCPQGVVATVVTGDSSGTPIAICATNLSTGTSPTEGSFDRLTGAIYSAAQLYNSTASIAQKTAEASGHQQSTTTTVATEPTTGSTSTDTASSTTQKASETALGGAPHKTALGTALALAGFGGIVVLFA